MPRRSVRRTSSRFMPGRRSGRLHSAAAASARTRRSSWSSASSPRARPGASQPVVAAVLGARQELGRGAAGALFAELGAHRVDHGLGHQAVGRELAAGDGEEARRRRRARGGPPPRGRGSCARVSVARPRCSSWKRGRTPVQACSARAWRKPGTSLARVEHLVRPRPGRLGRSSGSSALTSVVPMTLTVRIGTRMSPSAGHGSQRLITV